MNDERYSRQIRFRPIGGAGQERLRAARIAIVGMGALGTVSAAQLARAGVGYVRVIDRDVIEPSNLQRQSLYTEADARAGRPKAIAAAEALRAANSDITVEPVVDDVHAGNAESLLADVDVIVDGSDNFQVRYLLNDVAVKHGLPWAYAGAVSSHGTAAFFRPGQTPCFVCLLGPDAGGGHDTCETVGVIAPVVAMVASYQVAETLKYLTGNLDALSDAIFQVDVWQNEFHQTALGGPSLQCPCCVNREFQALAGSRGALTVSLCGRQTVQVRPTTSRPLSLDRLAERLRALGEVRVNEHLLRWQHGEIAISVFPDGRALVHGTDDPARARSLYAQYIGM
ncbi:thiamine/molybdopterin biosynthesis protein MoeB [Alicyclobacillus hesperidum subsp. aegles]|uniref:ThiF family adenylyltransferase n=1 Tax=Alicyclobacillus hesperidum TaxID=89784 RepID=UPI00222AE5F8|nr:ThiF family adenylyltransferase [Alicyclobacillus hesperidum]GLG00480.1 thiamine/molybdopterin biosynthesis protein MoeB [Alicyclobacillus hesperidum subsp. aegles]